MAVAAGVVAVLLGLEFLLFGDEVKRNVEVLLTHRSASAASDPGKPAPLPVLAPPAAGPVNQVELRPLDTCRAGAPCTVLMQVGIEPRRQPVEVAWRFEIVDRCRSGARRSEPGGSASIPAGQDRLVHTAGLALPPGRSLAVIPLVSTPARAAGPPMVVPGAADRC